MKKAILTTVVFLISFLTHAREYPFSIKKSGEGKQILIFIPGFACSGEVWSETVDILKSEHTCYVLTMPGFSGVAPDDNSSFEYWKIQISEFVKQEKIEKPILIGHSMGGGLALAIASDFPELCSKIVVVDALPCLMAITNPKFQSDPKMDCFDTVNRIINMNDEQFSQMQKMSVAGLTIDTSKFNEIVNWGLQSDRKTYAKIYCDFSNTDLREQIKNITIPSLILLEPQFKNIETVINEQYRNLSTAKLKYANKGLHFIMYDDRDWFIYQIEYFLNEK